MRLSLIVMVLVLALTGCAGANLQQANNQMRPVAQAEFSAWDRLTNSSSERCASGKDPATLNKAQAVAFAKCMDGYVETEIAPIAMYPDLLAQFRMARLKSRKELELGKITWEECRLQSGVDWHSYISAVDARVRQTQMQAYQVDVAQSQRMAAIGNALQAQAQQQELHDAMVNAYDAQAMAAQQSTMPRTYQTSCRQSGLGNTVNCTTR